MSGCGISPLCPYLGRHAAKCTRTLLARPILPYSSTHTTFLLIAPCLPSPPAHRSLSPSCPSLSSPPPPLPSSPLHPGHGQLLPSGAHLHHLHQPHGELGGEEEGASVGTEEGRGGVGRQTSGLAFISIVLLESYPYPLVMCTSAVTITQDGCLLSPRPSSLPSSPARRPSPVTPSPDHCPPLLRSAP